VGEEVTWTTAEGVELKISEMETSHIRNCIKLIQRKWDELDEESDYLAADGDGLTGVLFVPGREHYRPKLEALEAELKRREHETL
jgi:hypothetical protein